MLMLNKKFEKDWLELGMSVYYMEAIKRITEIVRQLNYELHSKYNRDLIDSVLSRVKTTDSIIRKLQRKGRKVTLENAINTLNDIAGVCVVCTYRDDVYNVFKALKKNVNFEVIKVKDYIKNPKDSGYRSIHLIVAIEINEKKIPVEIQIRTVAMNYWAKLDHQLCYKREQDTGDRIYLELKKYAKDIARIDKKMLKIRKEIEGI